MKEISLKEIQTLVYEEYTMNGYKELWNKTYGAKGKDLEEIQKKTDLAELGLIDTETAEAKEEVRNHGKSDKLGFECADIIIRTLNFMSRKGLDATKYIIDKHDVNIKREPLHGRRV